MFVPSLMSWQNDHFLQSLMQISSFSGLKRTKSTCFLTCSASLSAAGCSGSSASFDSDAGCGPGWSCAAGSRRGSLGCRRGPRCTASAATGCASLGDVVTASASHTSAAIGSVMPEATEASGSTHSSTMAQSARPLGSSGGANDCASCCWAPPPPPPPSADDPSSIGRINRP